MQQFFSENQLVLMSLLVLLTSLIVLWDRYADSNHLVVKKALRSEGAHVAYFYENGGLGVFPAYFNFDSELAVSRLNRSQRRSVIQQLHELYPKTKSMVLDEMHISCMDDLTDRPHDRIYPAATCV